MKNFKKYIGVFVTVLFLIIYFGYNFKINFKKKHNTELANKIALNFELKDITQSSKIDFKHEVSPLSKSFENIAPWLNAVGSSISLVDLKGDGWYDVYFTNLKIGSKNKYFRNNHDGTFTEIADELKISNVNLPSPSYRSIFIDINNDGFKDLILLSFTPKVFKNIKNKFFEEILDHGIQSGTFYGGVNLAELDRDGKLYLIISPYLNQNLWESQNTINIMPDNFSDSTNGVPIQIYRIGKDFKFESDHDKLNQLNHIGWGHSIGIFDIRNSGYKDIWFPKDYSTEKLFIRESDGYHDISNLLLQKNYGFGRNGMSIDFGDVDNDGKPLAFISHIFEPYHKLSGNNLWKWKDQKHFEQIADERGVQECSWAWGAKFVDFDNDSFLDLIVVNGFISNSSQKNYWYTTSVLDSSSSFIMKDSKNWPKMNDSSLAGYQSKCLFYNYKGNFLDIAHRTDLVQNKLDGRGVISFDILNNGSPGIAIVNQKDIAKIYINNQKNKNFWIGFKFKGTKSNIDGWGSKVIIYLKDKTLTRELEPLNGHASQSEDRLLIGLGPNPQIKKIEVQWPSGKIDLISDYKVNRYQTIIEK